MTPKAAAVATEIAKQKESARRNARDRKTSPVSIEFEAECPNIDDELALACRIELAAHVSDVHVDDVGRPHELEVPDVLEQHRARHDLARTAHEIFDQLEFLRQEFDGSPRAAHGAIDKVHFQIANLQPNRARNAPPPEKRCNAGAEFPGVKR